MGKKSKRKRERTSKPKLKVLGEEGKDSPPVMQTEHGPTERQGEGSNGSGSSSSVSHSSRSASPREEIVLHEEKVGTQKEGGTAGVEGGHVQSIDQQLEEGGSTDQQLEEGRIIDQQVEEGGNIDHQLEEDGNIDEEVEEGGNVDQQVEEGRNIDEEVEEGGNIDEEVEEGGNIDHQLDEVASKSNLSVLNVKSILHVSQMSCVVSAA